MQSRESDLSHITCRHGSTHRCIKGLNASAPDNRLRARCSLISVRHNSESVLSVRMQWVQKF